MQTHITEPAHLAEPTANTSPYAAHTGRRARRVASLEPTVYCPSTRIAECLPGDAL